jgi:hypothetical protein
VAVGETVTTTYHRSPDAASAEVDGETVVLSPTDLRYHSLNVTAAAIWEALSEPRTLDEVIADLLAQFEIDEPTCRAEVESCLGHLTQIGVVVTP